MTPTLQATCDAALTTLQTAVDAYQPSYYAAHGRYWQGLMTPATVPADGALVAPDLTLKPEGQAEDWSGVSIAATLPFSVQVDRYDGPRGTGYQILVRVLDSGQLAVRSIGIGPESAWRTHDWQGVVNY